ncbi:hypothetical protein RQP46_005825 [Phenoliferia psychrophenolica]
MSKQSDSSHEGAPDVEKVAVGSTDPKTAGERAYVAEAGDALALLDLVSTESPHHPIHWSAWKRWSITVLYCLLQVFVTLLSTDYVSIEFLIQEKWGGTTQVVTLGQSLFIIGTAVGPAFLGPASDLLGRKWLYVGAIVVYSLFNIGIALLALCNVAGTIADLFGDDAGAGQAMALFVSSANIGPSIGSPVGEWIADNPSMGFAWMGWLNVIIGFAFAIVMCFVPETLPRLVIAKAARGEEGDQVAEVLATTRVSVMKESIFVLTMALKMMVTEPIIIALGIYNGFAYGLLFLYLDGVFPVFAVNNGLSYIAADLTYLNFVVGVIIMFCFFVPFQTWLVKRDRAKLSGHIRPEARFLLSLVTVWGFPISLFWFAFTSNGKTSFWSPVCAGAMLGVVDPLLWMSMLNYITDSYPNTAGSAVAAFLIPSFLIAATCAHSGVAMFANLSTQTGFAILGGISVGIVGLVYVVYWFGPALRRRSKYARTF